MKWFLGISGLALFAAISATIPSHADGTPSLRICTGKPDLKYNRTGAAIGEQLRGIIDITLVPSIGSTDNLRKIADGKCDAAIIQSDAYYVYTEQNAEASLKLEDVGPLYLEYAHLLCNRESGINKISDLKSHPTTKVAIGEPTSGTATTWYALTAKDPEYNKVASVPLSGNLALTRIIGGRDAQCMLSVVGLDSQFMKQANELGDKKLQLVSFDDNAFGALKDGMDKPLYEYASIPGGTYYNLQYGMFSTAISTIAVRAEFVVTTEWYNKNSGSYGDLSTAILRMGQQMGGIHE